MGNPMQGQQMTQYMGGQMPQHRVQAPMGFGPNGHPQMMAGGVVDPGMIGGSSSSQQIMGQMPPGMNSQSGMMANGAQMIQGPRQAGPPQPVSTAPQTMMVPQSPGLMAAVNGPGPSNQQMRGQQNGMGSIPTQQQQDPEKRKLIQQQLVLLLHAHKCQQREKQEPHNRTQCNLPYCNVMKGVLEHMVTCNSGRQCQYAHCASSRQIITHWKNCNKEDCPVCNPVKKYTNHGASAADKRQGEIMLNASNLGSFPPQQAIPPALPPPAQQPQQQNQQLLPPGSGQLMMFGSPPSQATTVNNLLDGYNPNANPFQSTNPPNKVGQGSQQGMGQQQIAGFGPNNEGMPPPEPPSQTKDWHASITPDLRNHLVGKLVKAIFPSPDPAAIHDQRIRDLISYARKVEKDMFEAAPDKEAYYHMLAEKIYKIQKELQEKKNRRLNEQQQRPPGELMCGPSQLQPPPQLGGGPQQPVLQQQQQIVREIKQEPRQQQEQQQGQSQAMLNFVNESVPAKRAKIDEQPAAVAPSTSSTESPVLIKQELNSSSGGLFPPAETRRSTTPKDAKPSTSATPQEPIVRDPKVFDANELRNHLMPVWQKLWDQDPECIPFRLPVDPKELGIPDYFDVVKNPMDLQTIKANLDQGKYKNPWEFCDHMWLMFENAWLYNRKNTKVHKWCTRLSEIFIEEINPVMRQMGYCCGQKLSFTPLVQFCFGITKNNAACVIARDQPYFMYENSSSNFGLTVAERYIYCVKCFETLPDQGINLNENTTDPPNWIAKDMFQKMKNDQIDMEPFEHCQICDRKWHRICALHSGKINPEGFVCEHCRVEKSRAKPENKFSAKKLPHCQLSRYIEDRVNSYLRQKLAEGEPEVEVVIRVLCSSDKEVEVKPQMMKKYRSEGFPDRFPYRSKAVFAFEILKDPDTGISTEVCFFGLYVQEYGTNCQQPNQRRVYIAYLDSVHFFQPRHLRTSVYYEILLGYLQYVKRLGYTMAHIWACPPSEGDDYIFHCHPVEQKIPKPKRLQDWYKTMLNHGNEEGTVYSYKDIFNQAKDDALDTPMKLPYFEGDYWPRIIDECIVSAEKDEEIDKRKQQEETANVSDDDTFQTDDGLPVKKQQKSSSKKKNNLKKSAQNSKKKGGLITGNPIVDRLFQQLEKHRDVFFTIKLFSPHDEQIVVGQKPKIEDPDPLINCELMDTRDNFLAKSREEHWEFSQLRRAVWSTLNFCYTLHIQEQEGKGLGYTCNLCEQPAIFHCNTCDDYDLCEGCKSKVDHEHPLEKISTIEEQKSTDSLASSRNDSVKKCINSLIHACNCRDVNCRRGTCSKMKKVMQHTKQCKRRQVVGANCAVCKQLIALCCYHAKHCSSSRCLVPFCLQIRQKLQEQKRSQNRQAERMMQRRMMKLQSVNGGMAPMAPSTSASKPHQGPPSIHQQQNWVQPPQSPAHMSGQPQQFGSAQMQQMVISGGSQAGIMISPNAQQQMRLNGPISFHQVQNQQQMSNQMISSPPMGMQSHHPMASSSHQQQHPGAYQMMGHPQQQQQQPMQQMQMGMGAGIQRIPSSGAMHAQQQQQQMGASQQHTQQINPPPYNRPGPSQSQQQPGMSPFAGQQQMGQAKFIPQQQRFQQQQQMNQRIANVQEQQQFAEMGGQQQQHTMRPNDVNLIVSRLKEAKTPDERGAIFTELRKTPHLFNAFLKITNRNSKQGNDFMNEISMAQQQMRPPLPHQQQQQQQYGQPPAPNFYPGNPATMMQQQPQQNGGAQFNSPPQHQWMQAHQQQIQHPTQPPSQRNPT